MGEAAPRLDSAPHKFREGDGVEALISKELGWQDAIINTVKIVNKKRRYEVRAQYNLKPYFLYPFFTVA